MEREKQGFKEQQAKRPVSSKARFILEAGLAGTGMILAFLFPTYTAAVFFAYATVRTLIKLFSD